MSKYRQAARIDANQPEIVKALREKGISVQTGMDDLLVGYNGETYWFEIKTGPRATIKPSQYKLLDEWKGHYEIVWNVKMILNSIGFVTQITETEQEKD